MKLEHFLISLLTFLSLVDFAYIRNISPTSKTFNKRPAISSHAAFELAHTKIQLFDERMISSMAATSVRVFPVPCQKKHFQAVNWAEEHGLEYGIDFCFGPNLLVQIRDMAVDCPI